MGIKNNTAVTWLITGGMILLAVGLLLPLMGYNPHVYKWIFAAGALFTLVGRLFNRYDGPALRVKRLYRLEVWSSVFFCVAAFFMFYPYGTGRDSLAFVLAGGLILVYTSIMIPRTLAKESRSSKK